MKKEEGRRSSKGGRVEKEKEEENATQWEGGGRGRKGRR